MSYLDAQAQTLGSFAMLSPQDLPETAVVLIDHLDELWEACRVWGSKRGAANGLPKPNQAREMRAALVLTGRVRISRWDGSLLLIWTAWKEC